MITTEKKPNRIKWMDNLSTVVIFLGELDWWAQISNPHKQQIDK